MTEAIVLIFVLSLIGGLFVLPILALVVSLKARQEVDEIHRQLVRLEKRIGSVQTTVTNRNRLQHEFDNDPSRVRVEPPIHTPQNPPEPGPAPTASQNSSRDAGPLPGDHSPLTDPMGEGSATTAAMPGLRSTEAPQATGLHFDWEKFTGTRLSGWIGGFALFLGMAFLAKYSIENGLISPSIRVGIGCGVGLVSLFLGLHLGKKGYSITQHTLCAAGTAVLYAMVYASYDLYGFIGPASAFPLMILITTVAFSLSISLNSRYIALVGLAGAFLTPALISGSEDNPLGLFTYIALLDVALCGLVRRMRWRFLFPLSAVATSVVLWGWTASFFEVEKATTAALAWALFPTLYAVFIVWFRRSGRPEDLVIRTTGAVSLLGMSFVFCMISYAELAARPGFVFGYLLFLSLVLSFLAVLDERFYRWQIASGALAFLALMGWTLESLRPESVGWALGVYFIFSVLHGGFPVVLQRIRPTYRPLSIWAGIFPLLMFLPFIRILVSTEPFFPGIWIVLFLINALALACAFFLGITWIAVAFLTATLGLLWIHLLAFPSTADPLVTLWVVTLFSVGFFAVGLFFAREKGRQVDEAETPASPYGWRSEMQLPVFSTLLPFFLLSTAIVQLPSVDPTQVFGLAALLAVLAFGLVYFWRIESLTLLALAGVSLVEWVWYEARFDPLAPASTFFWNGAFLLFFLLVPFLFPAKLSDQRLVWWSAALAGPIHLLLIYAATSQALGTRLAGALPASLALVYLLALHQLPKTLSTSDPRRSEKLALFAGVTLFFVSAIFPLQLERQWLTVTWALEGLGLIWLHRRTSYPQLKKWAAGLLMVSFLRLALGPDVFYFSPGENLPVFNWHLYVYAAVLFCLAAGGRLWLPKEERYARLPVRPALYTMSAVLAFLLLNLEITDCFSAGPGPIFQFGYSLAQDLSYSLAWAVFGLGILSTGIRTQSRMTRIAALALIIVTTLKLFLYDLWYLQQLYRVAAFVGLASVLVVVSLLYQRYLGSEQSGQFGPGDKTGSST